MLEWLKTSTGAYNLTLMVAVIGWLIAAAGLFAKFHLNKSRIIVTVAVIGWLITGAGIFANVYLNNIRTIENIAKTNKAELDRADFAARLATTTAELESEKRKTADLQKKQAPRHLTTAQIVVITAILEPSSRGRIEIIVPLSSGDDALSFADEIFQLLKKLKFEAFEPIQAAYTPITGLLIQVKENSNNPTMGGFLQNAFQKAGYGCRGSFNPRIPDLNTVHLIIGSREYE